MRFLHGCWRGRVESRVGSRPISQPHYAHLSTLRSQSGSNDMRRAMTKWPPISIRVRTPPTTPTPHRFLTNTFDVAAKSQWPKRRGDAFSSLNMLIDALNRAKETTGVIPAKAAFTSAGVLLTMIRVRLPMVRFGGSPANLCRTR